MQSAECSHRTERWMRVRWLFVCVVTAGACGHRDQTSATPSSGSAGGSGSTITASGSSADASGSAAGACDSSPTVLGDGLVAEVHSLVRTSLPDPACFDVVRADPARYRLRVFTARDGNPAPAPEWRDRLRLVAVINAGMFHESGDPVGLIVERGTDLGTDNAKMGGFLAFDPVSPKDPPALVVGRGCPGFDLGALRKRYRSLAQSYRLIDCDGKPITWQDPKLYSAAAIGVDHKGRIVFIHARAPSTMTELATSLAPLDLDGALFLEGGPEASLVVRGDRAELSRVGSYESKFLENDGNTAFWLLPNILGLTPAPAP